MVHEIDHVLEILEENWDLIQKIGINKWNPPFGFLDDPNFLNLRFFFFKSCPDEQEKTHGKISKLRMRLDWSQPLSNLHVDGAL